MMKVYLFKIYSSIFVGGWGVGGRVGGGRGEGVEGVGGGGYGVLGDGVGWGGQPYTFYLSKNFACIRGR